MGPWLPRIWKHGIKEAPWPPPFSRSSPNRWWVKQRESEIGGVPPGAVSRVPRAADARDHGPSGARRCLVPVRPVPGGARERRPRRFARAVGARRGVRAVDAGDVLCRVLPARAADDFGARAPGRQVHATRERARAAPARGASRRGVVRLPAVRLCPDSRAASLRLAPSGLPPPLGASASARARVPQAGSSAPCRSSEPRRRRGGGGDGGQRRREKGTRAAAGTRSRSSGIIVRARASC